ncbi:hypothetical protein I549_2632 [Mycobacterium avium subsp. avium 2285 (R)]|nr:hypothetical protein I549_2632 [Mycobacterium avium subsp. avium 2285 (R)]
MALAMHATSFSHSKVGGHNWPVITALLGNKFRGQTLTRQVVHRSVSDLYDVQP